MAVLLTVVASAIACVSGNINSLLLTLLRVPDLLVVAVWLLSAFGWGVVLLRVLARKNKMSVTLRTVTSIAVGLGLGSLCTLAAGLAGVLSPITAWAFVGIGGVTAVVELWKHWTDVPRTATKNWQQLLWLFPIAIGTVSLICAMLPPGLLWGDEPNGYDVVEYHLQVPREWFEAGRIVPLTHNVFSYFPFNVEMHYLLAMELRGGPWAGMYVAQAMHVSFVVLAMLAVYALVAERSKRAAVVAATAVGCTPWFGLLAPVAYSEGGLLLWGTLAIGLLLFGNSGVVLAGVMAGLACGGKLTAAPIVLVAAPIAGVVMRQINWKSLAVYWLTGIATFSPWLIRNVVWTRNPVFPEMTSIFGRAHWGETQVERWKKANHEPRLEQQNVRGRIAAFRDQVADDWRFAYLLLPLGFVAAVLTWRDRRTRMLIGIMLCLCLFWTFFTHLQSRFFVMAIPLAGLLIGEAADLKPMRFVAAGVVVCAIGVGAVFWKVWSMDSRLFQLIGVQKLEGFTVVSDAGLPDGAYVTLIGDARAFDYRFPEGHLRYRTVFDVDARPGQSLVQAWTAGLRKCDGEPWRVIDPGELQRFSRTYWEIPKPSDAVRNMPGPTVERE